MQIEAVIGANYGDEGKGLFTEYLCRNRPKSLVVLSNGGCQRGHTVNNVEKGIRHVFHHFGSGTLVDVPSVFSSTYLLNPIKYIEEKRELEQLGLKPLAFRAPSCLLQLPSDMYVNQVLEMARDKTGRSHGSCGWGIWETQVRNRDYSSLTFETFRKMSYSLKRKTLLEALDWQIDNRIYKEGFKIDSETFINVVSYKFIEHFLQDFEEMASDCKILDSDQLLDIDYSTYGIDVETMIVENAQGLLLDTKYAPKDLDGNVEKHSTPSSTGLEGVTRALCCSNFSCTANYVTRPYFTRHGNGPFPEHTDGLEYKDKTNMPNQYQGKMRFGKMLDKDFEHLVARVEEDAASIEGVEAVSKIATTHMNECDDRIKGSIMHAASYLSYEDNSKLVASV